VKRIANPITTTELCSYGCGNIAQYINGSKRLMCCKSSNSCPENKRKNSAINKEAYNTGTRLSASEIYKKLDQSTKERMAWAKGLTKETSPGIASMSLKLKGRPGIGRPHTDETKAKLSKVRTEWLKNPLNRKNLGRHKKSWMELTFEEYLKYNGITGWDTEVHFWNEDLRKNYFPDFIFEDQKLIIELDGTQHRKTVEQDTVRDRWFSSKGYKVIRVPVEEFKKRHFSGQGFLDLIGNVA